MHYVNHASFKTEFNNSNECWFWEWRMIWRSFSLDIFLSVSKLKGVINIEFNEMTTNHFKYFLSTWCNVSCDELSQFFGFHSNYFWHMYRRVLIRFGVQISLRSILFLFIENDEKMKIDCAWKFIFITIDVFYKHAISWLYH